VNSSHAPAVEVDGQLIPERVHCKRERVSREISGMTQQLQQFGEEEQMRLTDSRDIMLFTMLSKLVMALVMGIVALVVILIS
jgi:hypothetical protein